MSTTRPNTEIVDLTIDELEESVEVLASAFFNDPFANYVLAHLGEDFPGCLNEFFRFTCEIRLELDWPLLGVVRGGQLQGVAGLSLPEAREWPPSLGEKLQHLKDRMGPQNSERLDRYVEFVGCNTPEESHYFFGVLGVHPRAQGQGLASLLISRTHELSESHPTSTGVALDTDTTANVAIYQHFGYQITAQTQLDDLTIYYMFRPNRAIGGIRG